MEEEGNHEFIEFEGRQVRIVKNLQVNVLETSETLLSYKFNKIEGTSMPTKNSEEEILCDDKKFVIRPSGVDIKPLIKNLSEVGGFNGSELFQDIAVLLEDKRIQIQNKNCEALQSYDVMKLGEDDLEIILDSDIEVTENETVVNIDTSSDPEVIVEDTFEIQKVLQNSSENENSECSLDFEENTDKNCNINKLKNLLTVNERRVKARKIKIMNLKTSLANMEKKNVEKKLSVQKRDIKIRELEETIKIKDIELVEKSAYISRLEEENDNLMKFKSGIKLAKKDLEIMAQRSDFSKAKQVQNTDGNISGKKIRESISRDPKGENAKSLSEFLSMIAKVKGAGDKSNTQRVSSNTIIDIAEGDVVEIDNDVIDIDIRISNEKGRYDPVNKSSENILLDGFGKLEHYPIFSEGASTIHEGTVDSSLRLKQFASRCAKSPNIVKMESKKRKRLSPSTTFSEGFPTKPNQRKNFSCDKCILVFMNQFELSLHKSTYHNFCREISM